MPGTHAASAGRVLISGASIAGPALAYWLDRYGFEVTVIERAPAIRSGGYPIDVRGTALRVVEQMGLLPDLQAAHIASRELRFVDAGGQVLARIPPYELVSDAASGDLELPRGSLTRLLYGLTQARPIRYRFNDSIETLVQDDTGVSVSFRSGGQARYDLVIGADGIHSRTRKLAFGPEAAYRHDLGSSFALFSMPNTLGLSHEAVIYSEIGRSAGLLAVRDSHEVFAFLTYADQSQMPNRPTVPTDASVALQGPDPGPAPEQDVETTRARIAAIFAGGGWEVPRLLEALPRAQDLYLDSVSQIRMPAWSSGRVALVGDAAYAPSFRSGQGTSLALVGAYVLAGELAAHTDPGAAFAAYERVVRPYVEANQALAINGKGFLILPRSAAELEARNKILAALAAGQSPGEQNDPARKAHNLLTLPDYSAWLKH